MHLTGGSCSRLLRGRGGVQGVGVPTRMIAVPASPPTRCPLWTNCSWWRRGLVWEDLMAAGAVGLVLFFYSGIAAGLPCTLLGNPRRGNRCCGNRWYPSHRYASHRRSTPASTTTPGCRRRRDRRWRLSPRGVPRMTTLTGSSRDGGVRGGVMGVRTRFNPPKQREPSLRR